MPARSQRRSHECRECHKIYAKAEHLIRHERTHTGSKPFTCRRCARSFSRQDSLARHIKRDTHARLADSDALEASRTIQHPPGPTIINTNLNNDSFPSFRDGFDSRISEQHTSRLEQDLLTSNSGLNDSVLAEVENDPFLQLSWPDSEELLQSLLSADFSTWQPPLEVVPSQSVLTSGQQGSEAQSTSPWLTTDSIESNTGHSGNHAVRNLSRIITTLSVDVASEAESTGLTTVFLDGCLHMFFTNFVPSFPVVHRPTFVFRDWTHPLLLNAIALGSLFMCQKENALKGEILWRLAHTAVATSWNTLIEHRGPHDACSGVQLVLTALLGQVYAISSTNSKLRRTAQIFHSLGFYWARECSMYEDEEVPELPAGIGLSHEIATEIWKKWAAQENQLRALLGHYVLDGQIAHYTGGPTCQRHASNHLRLPCDNAVFEALTVEEWISRMRAHPSQLTTFAELFNVLFSSNLENHYLSTSIPSLTANVLLEGLKSFVLESNDVKRRIVGVPDKREILSALTRLHQYIMVSDQMSSIDRCNAQLRWHAISLDAATDSIMLCRQMCVEFNIEQDVFGGRNHRNQGPINLREWVNTSEAKRALLHAVAMWDILQDLPLGRPHAIHVPASMFSAATIYCAYCISGVAVVQLPVVHDWRYVMTIDVGFETALQTDADFPIRQYFANENSSSRLKSGGVRNLLYDVNSLPGYLRTVSRPWGIAATLAVILEQLISFCST